MAPNRRDLFRSAAVLTAASYSRILGANDRIRVAGLGVGGRCSYLLEIVNNIGGCDIVAVCDVYEPRRDEARQKLAPGAQEYIDHREVLDRKDIDAVVIGSPDHWHTPMTIDSVRAGKDVYVEKPVTHAPQEGPALETAVRETGRIVQAGYQQRSYPHFIEGREIVASEKLGRITLITTSWSQNYLAYNHNEPVDASKLDWKRFLGSAPDQPVNALRYHDWRWFWDFGGGHLTDLFSHLGDVAQWYTGQFAPASAQGTGLNTVFRQFQCPDTLDAAYTYPGGFIMTYYGTLATEEHENIVFYGTGGRMEMSRGGFRLFDGGREPVMTARATEDGTIGHVRNFLDCVRSRKEPNAPLRDAVRAAETAHLGNVALRRGLRVATM